MRISVHGLKVGMDPFLGANLEVSNGTGGITRIFPKRSRLSGFCGLPFDSPCVVVFCVGSVFGFLATGLPSMKEGRFDLRRIYLFTHYPIVSTVRRSAVGTKVLTVL